MNLYDSISTKIGDLHRQSGYEVSLERRKIYVSIPDAGAAKLKQIRVIDESGEDYLYPKASFLAAELPLPVRRAVLQIA